MTVGIALSLSASAFAQTLVNGHFLSGDLTGWAANSIDGGQVAFVKQGTAFSSVPGSEQIHFPDASYGNAASLRAGTSPHSRAILTSDPFVPRSNRLVFFTLSETASVSAQVLIL